MPHFRRPVLTDADIVDLHEILDDWRAHKKARVEGQPRLAEPGTGPLVVAAPAHVEPPLELPPSYSPPVVE